ncbi:beta family protein, partial [Xanthomonas fragariae]
MNYSPVIRTRAAELRGLKELTDAARRKLFPIVELTRSRRTSKNPAGSISKSVEAICEILGEQPFVADLTSLESLQNSEFERLLDDDGGFQAWTRLATNSLPEQCIPVAHLLEPFDLSEFQKQISQLRSRFTRIAIRVPTNYGDF